MSTIIEKLKPLIKHNKSKLKNQQVIVKKLLKELEAKTNIEDLSKKYFNDWLKFLNTDNQNAFELIKDDLKEVNYSVLFKDLLTNILNAIDEVQSDSDSEKKLYIRWINAKLHNDDSWVKIDPEDKSAVANLLNSLKDGVILCKLMNHASPGIIDIRKVKTNKNASKFEIIENCNLCLKAGRALRFSLLNIGNGDIMDGNEKSLLSLIWQIMRTDLLSRITVLNTPELVALKKDNETMEHFVGVNRRDLLMRWVNHILPKVDSLQEKSSNVIENFSDNFKDSEVYVRLFHQLVPNIVTKEVAREILSEKDLLVRAQKVIDVASKFMSPDKITVSAIDIVQGSTRLNTAFLSSVFDNYASETLKTDVTISSQKLLDLTREVLVVAVQNLEKELPAVRSAAFINFTQAAKTLVSTTERHFNSEKLFSQLEETKKTAFENEKKLVETKTEIEIREKKIIELEKQIELLNQAKSQQDVVDQLKQAVKEKDENIQQLQKEIEDKISEVEVTKLLSEQFQSTANEEITTLKMEMETLKEESSSQLQQYQEEIDKLKQQNKELQSQIEQKEEKIIELEVSLETKKGELETKEKQLNEKEEKINELQKEISQSTDTNKELKEEISKLEAEIVDKNAKLLQSERMVSTVKEQLDKANNEIQQLEDNAKQKSEKTKHVVGKVVDLKSTLIESRKELGYVLSIVDKNVELKLMERRFGTLDCQTIRQHKGVVREGWLSKQGSNVKNWKKRYFILVENYMLYYGSEKEKEVKGFVRLDECKVEKDKDQKNYFRVITVNKKLYCRAETEEEAQQWIFDVEYAGSFVNK